MNELSIKEQPPHHGLQPSLGDLSVPWPRAWQDIGEVAAALMQKSAAIWLRCCVFVIRVLSPYHPFKLNWHSLALL